MILKQDYSLKPQRTIPSVFTPSHPHSPRQAQLLLIPYHTPHPPHPHACPHSPRYARLSSRGSRGSSPSSGESTGSLRQSEPPCPLLLCPCKGLPRCPSRPEGEGRVGGRGGEGRVREGGGEGGREEGHISNTYMYVRHEVCTCIPSDL